LHGLTQCNGGRFWRDIFDAPSRPSTLIAGNDSRVGQADDNRAAPDEIPNTSPLPARR